MISATSLKSLTCSLNSRTGTEPEHEAQLNRRAAAETWSSEVRAGVRVRLGLGLVSESSEWVGWGEWLTVALTNKSRPSSSSVHSVPPPESAGRWSGYKFKFAVSSLVELNLWFLLRVCRCRAETESQSESLTSQPIRDSTAQDRVAVQLTVPCRDLGRGSPAAPWRPPRPGQQPRHWCSWVRRLPAWGLRPSGQVAAESRWLRCGYDFRAIYDSEIRAKYVRLGFTVRRSFNNHDCSGTA